MGKKTEPKKKPAVRKVKASNETEALRRENRALKKQLASLDDQPPIPLDPKLVTEIVNQRVEEILKAAAPPPKPKPPAAVPLDLVLKRNGTCGLCDGTGLIRGSVPGKREDGQAVNIPISHICGCVVSVVVEQQKPGSAQAPVPPAAPGAPAAKPAG